GKGIKYDAVSDDRQLARTHNARRQQRQLIGNTVDNERMAGIMAALETHHDVGLLREPIDNLALAFVPPLGADDHHIRHGAPLRSARDKGGGTLADLSLARGSRDGAQRNPGWAARDDAEFASGRAQPGPATG